MEEGRQFLCISLEYFGCVIAMPNLMVLILLNKHEVGSKKPPSSSPPMIMQHHLHHYHHLLSGKGKKLYNQCVSSWHSSWSSKENWIPIIIICVSSTPHHHHHHHHHHSHHHSHQQIILSCHKASRWSIPAF